MSGRRIDGHVLDSRNLLKASAFFRNCFNSFLYMELHNSNIDYLFRFVSFEAIIITQNDVFVAQNQTSRDLLGYSDQEMLSMGTFQWIYKTERENVTHHLTYHDLEPIETIVVKYDGTLVSCEIRSRNIDFNGKSYIAAAIRDISRQKQIEFELNDKIKELEVITESIPNAIWKARVLADGAFAETFISGSVNNLLGLPQGTIKSNWTDYFKYVLPEYLPQIQRLFRKGTQHPGRIFSFDYQVRKGDGTLAWFISKGTIYTIDGKNYAYGFTYDITPQREIEEQLRQSEKKFRLLVEQSPDGVALINQKGVVIEWNASAERIIGLGAADALNKHYWDLLAQFQPSTKDIGRFKRKLKGLITDVFAQSKMAISKLKHEQELVLPDGDIRYLANNYFEIEIHGKKFLCVLMRDVTKTKQHETRLKELNETKDRFFSIISHDLRNPFTAFMGFSELMLRQIERNEYGNLEKYARAIFTTARQGGELLTNLLDWSRSQRGKLKYTPEVLRAGVLIQSALNYYQEFARSKEIDIIAEVENEFEFTGDKNMLESVLRNLLSNAIKFSKRQGKIHIVATLNSEFVQFSVSDNGVGISADVQKELFLSNYINTTLGTEQEHGTGLGLFLCKEFVQLHDGNISVSSEPGRGTTFIVSIPFV